MKNQLWSLWSKLLLGPGHRRLLWLVCAWLAAAPAAPAAAPDWVRAASQTEPPRYAEETEAVVLLKEETTSVSDSGEVKTLYRRVCRILRPQGRHLGTVVVHFDSETRLTGLKAWSITARGDEYEVKEKDAVETGAFGEALYADKRSKVLVIPAAEPGNTIAWEYEQKRRASILQDTWWFQEDLPVRLARFSLSLPSGWEFDSVWLNYGASAPRVAGQGQWVWELSDVPALEQEPHMPAWRGLAGRLAVSFYPPAGKPREGAHHSWQDVASWYARLAAGRSEATEEIRRKVSELAAGLAEKPEKVLVLASFVQKEVRYVAIEIGIGGYQPHGPSEVFSARYGDCKDKANLLRAMLQGIGVDSYMVLVHSSRGVVSPDFPSMYSFNHMILAVRLPDQPYPFFSLIRHNRLGPLVIFDPTDGFVPFGSLPTDLQAGHGLLVTEQGAELLKLPEMPPPANRLMREGKFQLGQDGTISGVVNDISWGEPAVQMRAEFAAASGVAERRSLLENFLARSLAGFRLGSAQVGNLGNPEKNLQLTCRFSVPGYARTAGKLMLLRPRVVGSKALHLSEEKPRRRPVEFRATGLDSDIFEFTLPAGYEADELPAPLDLDAAFAEYHSSTEVNRGVLRYTRRYTVKQLSVPADRIGEVREFFRKVAEDEASYAVLKYTAPAPPVPLPPVTAPPP